MTTVALRIRSGVSLATACCLHMIAVELKCLDHIFSFSEIVLAVPYFCLNGCPALLRPLDFVFQHKNQIVIARPIYATPCYLRLFEFSDSFASVSDNPKRI